MINTLRSEWIKLRTVRMNTVLTTLAVAFPLIVCVLTTSLQKAQDINSEDLLGLITGTSVVSALLLGVIGASSITGEFGFGTIRPTFAATPRRSRVIVAKGLVVAAVALVVEAAIVFVAFVVCSGIASSRDRSVSLGDVPAGAAPIIGVIVFAGLVTMLGYGLGLLIRNTPASVAVLILWPLVVENIVFAILNAAGVDRAGRFLPYTSGFQMANPSQSSDSDFLGRIPAGLYFGGVTLAIVLIGAVLTTRRDA